MAGNQGKTEVRFHPAALKELRSLGTDPEATLIETLNRKARGGTILRREDEKIDAELSAIRATVDGDEYRLLYGRLRLDGPIVYVGAKALAKKSKKLPKKDISTAKTRLREWRKQHEPDNTTKTPSKRRLKRERRKGNRG